jgi:hypothetical protein
MSAGGSSLGDDPDGGNDAVAGNGAGTAGGIGGSACTADPGIPNRPTPAPCAPGPCQFVG